jgi:hypothetical protein
MLTVILAIFLILHGLVHAILAFAPVPNEPDAKPGAFFTTSSRSWLLARLGINDSLVQWIGIILVVLSTLGFILAGLGVLGALGLNTVWETIAIVSAAVSLLLLILFWHTWLIVGVLIDVGVLLALLWVR